MKISTILDKIDEYRLLVPAFQREYVWKKDDAKQLIDSLIKEYPTGTMLTWETSNPPELKGPHKHSPEQGAVLILLDGQQRITTLYILMRGKIPPYYELNDIKTDIQGLYVNLETLELGYYNMSKMDSNPYWQSIKSVFLDELNPNEILKKLKESGRDPGENGFAILYDNIYRIKNIKEREFPGQQIPAKAGIRTAIDIFYKVNASGITLTDAELALAQISGYWSTARESMKIKLEKLSQEGYIFKIDFIIYVLLGCLYHIGSDMRKLHSEENLDKIRETWNLLETNVLDYVVNIMRERAFVDHTKEINSSYALVPIIVYCFDKIKTKEYPNETQVRMMIKWFYYSQVRSRYSSQLPQKLDKDLQIIANSQYPFDELLGNIAKEKTLEIYPSDFKGCWSQHPFCGLMGWYFKSKNAKCLTTGMPLRGKIGELYQIKYNHIFLYSEIKKLDDGKENSARYSLTQEFTNRAILKKDVQRIKTNNDASNFLASVQRQFPDALKLQCIPTDETLWKLENFEQFIEARRNLLANEFNAFLSGITEMKETEIPITLEDMIAEGESDVLEFKSTFQWDVKEGKQNKELESEIIKTVAAFANGQGGTLLIGVADDGNIIGLDYDYTSLNIPDCDKFELRLRERLSIDLGKVLVASKLKCHFHSINDKEVCEVEVSPATAPIIIKTKKNGNEEEIFYVRNGNASQKLSKAEMADYIMKRF